MKKQKAANLITTANETISIGRDRGIMHLVAQDKELNGNFITLDGKPHINFGSCSYLGLEFDQRLIEGSVDALNRYGTQFSSSRTYMAIPLYNELEELLGKMFGRPVILSSCSSLGHQAIIPIIVEDDDAVILDQQAHVSMQEAVARLQVRGVTVTVLRHNRLDELQNKIEELGARHNKVWYFIDGIYSMYGDYAPIHELMEMLNRNKQMMLYVDDAHGMSWAGVNGAGYIRSQTDLHPRMVLATSLAKGFASAGGVFVLPTDEMYWKVRTWGGSLTYSGPQQPAVLGASIASAKIHLSNEINVLQKSLAEKISFCNEVMNHYDLPLVSQSSSPIFFVGLGLTKVGYNMVKRLKNDGFYVNLGIFPAVPETCTGIRFTITNHLKFSDIEALGERIYYHLPKALKEEERSRKDIYRAFKALPGFKEKELKEKERISVSSPSADLYLQHETTISAIPEKLWNDLLGNDSFDWQGLAFLEKTFQDNPEQENNWDFHYYIIKDSDDKPIIATYFTCLLTKDDLFSSENVSRKLEEIRVNNPYYLTSKTFLMGSSMTDGEQIYINRLHPRWKEALMMLLDEIWAEQERQKATTLLLRDFHLNDLEIRDFLIDQGFIKINLPDTHTIDNSKWSTKEEYLSILPHKKRTHIKKDVLAYEPLFEVSVASEPAEEEIRYWYKLYCNVKKKNLELNTFILPEKLFFNMAKSSQWDIIVLNFKPEHDKREGDKLPVAVGFSYKNRNYTPVILGIDYNYISDYNIYKQMLYQFIPRALYLNTSKIFLGLTASLEKRKLGAIAIPKVAYVQMKDNYNMILIDTISNTKD